MKHSLIIACTVMVLGSTGTIYSMFSPRTGAKPKPIRVKASPSVIPNYANPKTLTTQPASPAPQLGSTKSVSTSPAKVVSLKQRKEAFTQILGAFYTKFNTKLSKKIRTELKQLLNIKPTELSVPDKEKSQIVPIRPRSEAL